MKHPSYSQLNSDLSGGDPVPNQLDFFDLYDRYAPILLGTIKKIISDEVEAVAVLEKTFIKVRAEMSQFRPGQKPIFSWLLTIARCAASDALSERRQPPTPVLQFTANGKIVALPIEKVTPPVSSITGVIAPQLKKLLDSVLYQNCTPEEGAVSMGIPVETARQQLRLALQQLRTLPKA